MGRGELRLKRERWIRGWVLGLQAGATGGLDGLAADPD